MGKVIVIVWAFVTALLAVWSVSSALFDGQYKRLLKRLGLAIVWPLALFSYGGLGGLWSQFRDIYSPEEK